jgi:hypothetical protein
MEHILPAESEPLPVPDRYGSGHIIQNPSHPGAFNAVEELDTSVANQLAAISDCMPDAAQRLLSLLSIIRE